MDDKAQPIASMNQLSDDDYQRAFRYARSLGADHDLALDLVQTAVMKGLAVSSAVEEPLRYLMTSVRNAFISDVRRAQQLRWIHLDDLEGVIATDMQPLEDVVMNRDALRAVWAELGDAEREVLHLWAVEGYTVDEISEQTRTPRGTLLARLHRLRRRLVDHPTRDTRGASR